MGVVILARISRKKQTALGFFFEPRYFQYRGFFVFQM
jgi:hypothetical protein